MNASTVYGIATRALYIMPLVMLWGPYEVCVMLQGGEANAQRTEGKVAIDIGLHVAYTRYWDF
jgi:hypothetical protein